MRAASALVHLALGLVYFIFGNLLWTLAGFSFSAGPSSLTPAAARMGLLAYAFGAWFMVAALQMFLRSPGLFQSKHKGWLTVPELSTPGCRSKSFTDLFHARRVADWFIPLLAWVILFSAGRPGVPGLPAVLWWVSMCVLLLIERRFFKGQAIWHRLPGFFAWALTFTLLLLSWVLFRSASLEQARHYFLTLFGGASLTETAVLLDARMFTDFHVLLMLVSTVIVFILPPLHRFIEPLNRWKSLVGGLGVAGIASFLFIPSFRTRVQCRLYTQVGAVNDSVVIGQDGWLFDPQDLRALTGSGPLQPEWNARHSPTSRARDEIVDFARQLKARGVPLLLIPIPMKASIYPEAITGSDPDHSEVPLYQEDQRALYEQLVKAGIDVQDITSALLQLKARHKPVFFKQDTHWTPEAMQDIARAVAVHVRKKFPGIVPNDPLIVDTKAPDAASLGDLAERLNPLPGAMSEEQTVLVSFPNIENDPKSPIVLLGDDFTRIYDDPSLGFVQDADTHASFAQHLALYLGMRIDTTAVNHGGTTAVRRAFAKRLDDEVRAKKLVIWLVPARDLVLPPSAGVEWQDAVFNTQSSPAEVLIPMVPRGR